MRHSPVFWEEISAVNGKRIGRMVLNVEKKLNSLTLEMVNIIRHRLAMWIKDETIACVVVMGSGDRAFCAGGDVQALYASAIQRPGGPCVYAEAFFENEYRMDYLFHTCLKPVVAWGNGIIMGGGLGILAGCSHRVVTETARLAMPEITIALYPDVGGGWFFNRMPGKTGLFLALTGMSFNAADALYTGIADFFVRHEQFDAVMKALIRQDWSERASINHEILNAVLNEFSRQAPGVLPEGNIEARRGVIDALGDGTDGIAFMKAVLSGQWKDQWLAEAAKNLAHGSPLSAHVIYRHMARTRGRALNEVFQMELVLSTNLVRYPEFTEGVRALLIEKDKKPKWKYATLEQVAGELVDQLFTPPWPENPLSDM